MGAATEGRALEQALVKRARAGDERAFSQLVEKYQGPVYRLCRRYVPDAEAQDVAQDTFVRAFVHRSRFDPDKPILSWLFTVARNRCVDLLRRKKPSGEPEMMDKGDNRPDPEVLTGQRQEVSLLQEGLKTLADGPREAVVLYHVEGLSYEAIAQSLEVPVGTVMTWLHRGRAKLRALLEAAHAEGTGETTCEAGGQR